MLCLEKMVPFLQYWGLPSSPSSFLGWLVLKADKTHSVLTPKSLRGKEHHHLLETVVTFLPDLISSRNGALRLPAHLDFLQGDH